MTVGRVQWTPVPPAPTGDPMTERMLRNSIRCAHCGVEIESTSGHDYRTHSCQSMRDMRGPDAFIGVDGGLEPGARRVGHPADWLESSLTDPPADPAFESAARAARIRAIDGPSELELVALATSVIGSAEAAAAWMQHPQVGLGGQRPTDLLSTAAGAQLVEGLLQRM